MLQVRFFARVREALGTAELSLAPAEAGGSLDELRQHLMQRGPAWSRALDEPNLVCAVNRAVVHGDVALADGDEVAFYPPVTGG